MSRVFNFAAGPAMLPESVLLKAQEELLNWQNTNCSILEIGHRTTEFQELLLNTECKLRNLMDIPDNYKILFLPGGAQGHFSFIPMNLCGKNQQVDYLVSGTWSERAAKYAAKYAEVNIVSTASFYDIPDKSTWKLNPNAAYVYYCPNETISGMKFKEIPETGDVPLVADFTSSILSEHIDVNKFGVIFASAQKNLGISGITVIIIRDNLLNQEQDITPQMLSYKIQSEQGSLLNTIPTAPIYIMNLMLEWIINEYGGLNKLAIKNHNNVKKLYNYIDSSNGFYKNLVKKEFRSLINVPFNFSNDDLLDKFLVESSSFDLAYLNGHKTVGGARASLYNAMPEAGVDRLIEYMKFFAAKYTQQV